MKFFSRVGFTVCAVFPATLSFFLFTVLSLNPAASAQNSSATSNPSGAHKSSTPKEWSLPAGSISNGIYRNSLLGFACKIPAGWVLRTEPMNALDGEDGREDTDKAVKDSPSSGRVLLAAFSRPPQARGEDVNSSILIAAERVEAYPGLKEAAQYFGPVTEIAEAQGFDVDEEPYEFPVGAKTLVRSDYEKNLGTRVMHQSTLVMLARGYAVSFTFIGGTEDEVEELVQGLGFEAAKPAR
jgi:hypothetical protein